MGLGRVTAFLLTCAFGATFSVGPANADRINALEYAPDGTVLAVASTNGNKSLLQILDSGNYDAVKSVEITKEVVDIAYSPSGKFLAVARNIRNNLYVIEVRRAGNLAVYRSLKVKDVSPFTTHKIAFVGDTKMLAIARFSEPLLVWSFRKSTPKTDKYESWITGVASPTKGKQVAYGRGDTTSVLNLKKNKEKSFGKDGSSISYGKGNKRLAVGREGAINIYNPKNGKLVSSIRRLDGTPSVISFQSKGNLLATVGIGADVAVYNTKSGERLFRAMMIGADDFMDASLSPNGKLVAAGSEFGTLSVWDVKSGSLIFSADY